jgi:hypothetical protein
VTVDVEPTIRFLYESCGLRYDQVSDTAVRAALTSLVERAESAGYESGQRDAAQDHEKTLAELHAWRMTWYGGNEYLKAFDDPRLDPETTKAATTAIEGYRDIARRILAESGLETP